MYEDTNLNMETLDHIADVLEPALWHENYDSMFWGLMGARAAVLKLQEQSWDALYCASQMFRELADG